MLRNGSDNHHRSCALVRIGTASVIDELTQRYERETEWYYRLYASGVFGKIKLQASEDALLQLLPLDQDLTYCHYPGGRAMRIGSSKGIPVVLEMVENGYDNGYRPQEIAVVNCIMNEVDLPNFQLWREEIAEEERDGKKYKKCCGGDGVVPSIAPQSAKIRSRRVEIPQRHPLDPVGPFQPVQRFFNHQLGFELQVH